MRRLQKPIWRVSGSIRSAHGHWNRLTFITSVSSLLSTTFALAGEADAPVDIRDGYVKFAVGSHLVFYRLTDTNLDVMRILHVKMDAERHL